MDVRRFTPGWWLRVAAVVCAGTMLAGLAAAQTPLVWLKLDEVSGATTANDGTAGGHLTRTTPTPAWSANVPGGAAGAASVDFGTTQSRDYYVEGPNTITSQLNGLTSFTITGWLNMRGNNGGNDGGGFRIVHWLNQGSGPGVDFVWRAGGKNLAMGINQWADSGGVPGSSNDKITIDPAAGATNWVFFAVTYDSTINEVKYYFGNNASAATLDVTRTYNRGAVGASAGTFAIGNWNDKTRGTGEHRMCPGLIADIRVYGTTTGGSGALSLADIQAIQFPASQKIVFTSPPQALSAGAVSSSMTIQRQDDDGAPQTAGALTVNLVAPEGGVFLDDADGVTAITSVTIAEGQSAASFKYKDTVAGGRTIRAGADEYTPGRQAQTIAPLAVVDAAQSTCVATPASVKADNASTSTITVTLRDRYGNAAPVVKSVTLAALGGGGSTIGAPNPVDTVNGVATFTVKDAVVESVAYYATNTTDGFTVAQQATVNFVGRGLRIFHIGNSLTDQACAATDIAKGNSHTDTAWGRFTIPGASIHWCWSHPGNADVANGQAGPVLEVLEKQKWDALVLQLFPGNGDTAQTMTESGGNFAEVAYRGNPDCQVYVFGSYPGKEHFGKYAETVAKFDAMAVEAAAGISKRFPDRKPALVIPVAQGFQEIGPKIGGVERLYKNDIHANSEGKYLEAIIHFATIYRLDPRGSVTSGLYSWDGPYSVSEDFAAKAQEVAWAVVRKHPLSGAERKGDGK